MTQLFIKDRKGDLLRRLFELETQSVPKQQTLPPKKQVVWMRKFDSDDAIVIEEDNKYL